MVTILLATGFEEVEALTPCDLLRRAGVEVQLAGVDGLQITGSHGITVCADCLLTDALQVPELLVIPGGLGGVQGIRDSAAAMDLISRTWQAGKLLAAICAGPTVLASLGITDGKKATCFPSMQDQMGDALLQDAPAVRDGRVITGTSAGTALPFALELVAALCGRERAQALAREIVCPA